MISILAIVDEVPHGANRNSPNPEVEAVLGQLPPFPKWAQVNDSADRRELDRIVRAFKRAAAAGRCEYASRSTGETTGVWIRRRDPAGPVPSPVVRAAPRPVTSWTAMSKTERQAAFIEAWKATQGDVVETARRLGVSEPTAYTWRRDLRTNGIIS